MFISCLVDQFCPSVGHATVAVLRRAGCEVAFNQLQTCCGQPAFNAGYHDEARKVGRSMLEAYAQHEFDALVIPSGSCTAMVRHLQELFPEHDPAREMARELARNTHELGSFLVNVLGVEDLGAHFDGRLTWHDACHGLRDLGIREEPRRLIAKVAGAQLVEVGTSESCCGFGGTFSVKYPEVSVAMLDWKLQAIETSEVDAIVSGDVSCLMQIEGRLRRRKSPVRALHLAELLASGAAS